MIPLNDPVRLYRRLQPAIDDTVAAVLASGRWINGPFTERFAASFAEWCGATHCVPVGNGSDALEFALRALAVGPGDEVITVANAGAFATSACRSVGAIPVWIDVRADTLGLDPKRVADALTPRTKVIVATHLFGIVVDVPTIRNALDRIGRQDVRILEDCAQAQGARRDGRRVGVLGDIAAFSFYPTKNLGAFGNAGAVVTNDSELAERVAWLQSYGWKQQFQQKLPFGRNARIDELQAAVLCVKLPHVDAWNAERRQIFERYVAAAQSPSAIVGSADPTNVCHLAVLRTPDRIGAARALADAEIATTVHYPVLDCDQMPELNLAGRKQPLPVSERARDEILSLPCYPGMTELEIEHIAKTLAKLRASAQ